MCRYLAVFGLMLLFGLPANAEEPMILVESISAPASNVSPMTYINTGATIDLGQSTVLVLDYLNSCVRQTITGGVVHVGVPVSQVDNGSFKNARLACGVVYRALGDPLLIHSTDPLFVATTAGTLVITQEGEPESPKIQLQIPDNGRHGPFALDLSKANAPPLQPGITYRATMGDRHVIFRVAQGAGGDNVPALQRIVPI
jgi:hypothetical protein